MKNIIVGTAGHIDHGKTALVRALTGIDTDRLEEEKRRGISIDLGFAHMDLAPDVRVGFVDVPGHERFVKNMLAGVGGIDLVLLVIAADESIKPQTREHFDICRLLGISKGAVVLTKADLVEADLVDLVKLEAEEFVAGSFLEGAPTVAVSSTTGAGLDELRAHLLALARGIPVKDTSRHFRLPVDRAFSIHGFGTVVTGTLISGAVSREQEVDLHPAGRRLRVRGVQVHGDTAERAVAGQRTALNLAGIEPSDIGRGMTLSAPGLFRPVDRIDCRLDLLASAKPLKHRAPIHFHTGTAEVEAEVRLFDAAQPVRPGATSYVRFVLKEPLLMLPGDRFIIRMFSPVVTIGGGAVVDIDPPRKGGPERLRALDGASIAETAALLVRESPHGLSLGELIARTGMLASELEPLATIRQPQTWFFDPVWAEAKRTEIRRTLADFHRTNPLAPGMPKEALRAAVLVDAPAFVLDALIPRDVVAEAEAVRLASHKVVLKEDEERATGAMEAVFREAGLAVPSLGEALSKSGLEPARARTLLQMLLRQGRLVKISEDLVFHRDALDGLRDRLASHRGEKMTVVQFKDLAGISRKYAIPLLEYLDRTRLTRREGDARLVL
ncbi:MAG TPA: selenocysteine-specific translation elongation factor [Bryobacteraceae bacterium]|nr:selenocysteine-specific translation elongation factor [Bryobacteraceae bacterium]